MSPDNILNNDDGYFAKVATRISPSIINSFFAAMPRATGPEYDSQDVPLQEEIGLVGGQKEHIANY